MQVLGIDVGTQVGGQKMRRIGGWGAELREWLDEVRLMLMQQR
jgi:hypothetical protein